MDHERQSLRIGAAAIACALVIRLLAGGILQPVAAAITNPDVASFLVYLESGRIVRTAPYAAVNTPEPESHAPETTIPSSAPIPTAPEFTAADLDLIRMRSYCSYEPDLEALLTAPLEWDLHTDAPAVLILHTHTTESYTPTKNSQYEESSEFRTLDEEYNMLAIGDAVARALEEGGISVIHDRALHDYPSYNGSYEDARQAIEDYLTRYPSIRMVLDLHRDAVEVNGGQLDTSATVDGRESAQIMLVQGCDAGGLVFPGWQDNMALALKLHAQLERDNPGLTRPISFRSQRFNLDETSGSLLIEVGAAGNTLDEALVAADALSKGILALAQGANLTTDSTN